MSEETKGDKPSTPNDADELRRLEKQLLAGKLNWIATGRTLSEISGRGLYAVRVATFEDYLRGWGFKRRQANSMMKAAALVAPNLGEIRHALSLRAALELVRVDKGKQGECVRVAIADSGSLSPSAEEVAAAVLKVTGNAKARRRANKSKPKPLRLPSGTITFILKRGADLRSLIQEALAKLSTPPTQAAA